MQVITVLYSVCADHVMTAWLKYSAHSTSYF
jgi:hypothetical protein